MKKAQDWYETTSASAILVSQWTNIEPEIILRSLSRAYCNTHSGRFFSEMSIRPDWIDAHICELKTSPGNEFLDQIRLTQWIQPELLQVA